MNTGRIILLAGLSLFIAGSCLTAYSFFTKRDHKPSGQTKELVQKLRTAAPRFEIGYTLMSLAYYQRNQALSRAGDSSLLTFPIYENDIATRLSRNSPPLVPTYNAASFAAGAPAGFARLYNKKQLQHRATGVICLIIKQTGAGNAQATTLQTAKVTIKGLYELYDALDLVGDSLQGQQGINRSPNKSEQQVFSFGTMKTGRTLLIPLCITNMYWRTDGESDPSGWQVTSQVAYVPLRISYRTSQGEKLTLPLHDNLRNPIYME